MSSTRNTLDKNTTTAAIIANQNAGVDSLGHSNMSENHDMALTSGSDGHTSKNESLIDSQSRLDENEWVHDAEINRLCETLMNMTREMTSFTEQLDGHLFLRIFELEYARDPLGNKDIRDVLPYEMLEEQDNLTRDTQCISEIFVPRQTYKIIERGADDILETASRILASSVLASNNSRAYKQAKEAVSRFKRDVLTFNEDVNNILATVFLSSTKASERLHSLYRARRSRRPATSNT